MKTASEIPQRFTEKAFRLYESTIATAVELFPSRLVLQPRGDRSQETIAARLRDALRSFHTYRWSTTQIEVDKFNTYYDRIQVCREDVNVIVRVSKDSPVKLPHGETHTLSEPTLLEIDAFILIKKYLPPLCFINVNKEGLTYLRVLEDTHTELGFAFEGTKVTIV
jgi:hypothetical protein